MTLFTTQDLISGLGALLFSKFGLMILGFLVLEALVNSLGRSSRRRRRGGGISLPSIDLSGVSLMKIMVVAAVIASLVWSGSTGLKFLFGLVSPEVLVQTDFGLFDLLLTSAMVLLWSLCILGWAISHSGPGQADRGLGRVGNMPPRGLSSAPDPREHPTSVENSRSAGIAAGVISRREERPRGLTVTLDQLKALSPEQFERFVAEMFRRKGYLATVVGAQGDHGIDIILESPKGERELVQCKKWTNRWLGERVVRDFYGAFVSDARAVHGYVISTSFFSDAARTWVRGKPIKLIDGPHLLRFIAQSAPAGTRPSGQTEGASRVRA